MAKKTPTEAITASDFLRTGMDRWRSVDTFEGPQRIEGQIDLRFLNLQQWDPQDEAERKSVGKHALVIDQIGEPYRQLLGSQRSARPGIQVNPVDSGADVDTAEAFQKFIRHIETVGGAKAARDEAFKGAIGPGWGYYRLLTEYAYDEVNPADPATLFDQTITYQAIENQFTVFRDPACPLHEPWKMRYAFVVEDVPIEDFKRRWPKAAATSQEAFAATGLQMPEWFPTNSVRVADYLYVEEVEGAEVALLPDGSVVPSNQVPPGVTPLQKRKPITRTVKQAKITGAEVLEGNADKSAGQDTVWPYIPIVMMYGDSLTVDGKRNLRGIVRAARDLMRAYNYEVSELLYELALSPKSKVLMAAGQQEGHEEMWKQAPGKAMPYLLYEPTVTTVDGRVVQVEAPKVAHFTDSAKIQALVIAINQLKTDLRSVTGWYDATDPNRKNTDQSGRAILARKESQAEGAVNYKDNFGQALLYEGLLLLGAIPKVFGRPGRILRMLGDEEDKPAEEMTVGQPMQKEDGSQGIFAWGAGRYDCTVSIGASYTTSRQEAADVGLEMMKALPPQMSAAMAPLVIRNMDTPGAREIAERLDRTLPPEITQEKDAKQPPIPPQIQQQMQEMQQMIEIQTKELNAKNDWIEKETGKLQAEASNKSAELQSNQATTAAELASKERIVAMQEQTKLILAELAMQKDLALAELNARQASLSQLEGQAHEDQMAEAGHARNLEMQANEPQASA